MTLLWAASAARWGFDRVVCFYRKTKGEQETRAIDSKQIYYSIYGTLYMFFKWCLKENQNAPGPSEHPPGVILCRADGTWCVCVLYDLLDQV